MQQAASYLGTRVEQQGALLAILVAQLAQQAELAQQAQQAQQGQQAQREGEGTAGPAAQEQLQQLAAQLEEQGQQRQRLEGEVTGHLQLTVADLADGCAAASAMLPQHAACTVVSRRHGRQGHCMRLPLPCCLSSNPYGTALPSAGEVAELREVLNQLLARQAVSAPGS